MKQLIEYLTTNRYIVCFFDTTGINESSFKSRSWAIGRTKPIIKRKFAYNMTHILSLITVQGVYFFEFVKGSIINFDIIDFLYRVTTTISINDPTKEIVIVLTTLNFTKRYTLLISQFNITFTCCLQLPITLC